MKRKRRLKPKIMTKRSGWSPRPTFSFSGILSFFNGSRFRRMVEEALSGPGCDRAVLRTALEIAFKAHAEQLDKGGVPYIFHPIRVAMGVARPEDRLVALLHDVVEDSAFSFSSLLKYGIPTPVVETVAILTRHRDESYEEYVDNICRYPEACRVKLSDLADNMEPKRPGNVIHRRPELLKRYRDAKEKVESALKQLEEE